MELGTPFTFGPEGTQFAVPVTVTLGLGALPSGTSESSVVILTAPAGSGAYAPLTTSVADNSHVSAPTTHFSTFVPAQPSGPGDAAPPDGGTADGTVDSNVGDSDAQPGDGGGGGGGDGGVLDAAPDTTPDAAPDATPDADVEAGCVTPTSMFDAAIVPPTYAGIDFSNGGSGNVTLAQIVAVDCVGTAQTSSNPGYDEYAWGSGAVVIDFNPTNGIPYVVTLGTGYTGTMAFNSRTGGAWGTHTYVAGVGTLTRDGAPVTIDWSGDAGGPNATVTELADAYLATFVPAHAAEPTNCVADGTCRVIPDDGNGHSLFGIRNAPTLSLYIMFPIGTSTPSSLYSFWLPGQIQPTDAGAD